MQPLLLLLLMVGLLEVWQQRHRMLLEVCLHEGRHTHNSRDRLPGLPHCRASGGCAAGSKGKVVNVLYKDQQGPGWQALLLLLLLLLLLGILRYLWLM
jgi:hypothetical protein